MTGRRKAEGLAGVGAAIAAGIAVAVHMVGQGAEAVSHSAVPFGHGAEAFGHNAVPLAHIVPPVAVERLFPATDRSASTIAETLRAYIKHGHSEEVFVSALCNSVAGIANDVSPDENVGDTLKSAVSDAAGVPVYLAQDKFNQMQATFQLSQWDGAAAWKYVQVCHKAGLPRR